MYGKLNLICLQLTPIFQNKAIQLQASAKIFSTVMINMLIYSYTTKPMCVLFKIVSTSCYLVIYYILLNDAFSISDCTVENDRIIKK